MKNAEMFQYVVVSSSEMVMECSPFQDQSQEKGLDLLGGIMKGIEQAGREMQKEHQLRQQQKVKG